MTRTNVNPDISVHEPSTRERLIAAAGEVFSLRGFEGATVREIVQKAGANLAAINYHFGDKASLYREALIHAHRETNARYPLSTAGAGLQSPEDQLREYVRMWLLRLLEDSSRPMWPMRLLARELLEPSPALDTTILSGISVNFRRLVEICKGILGPAASEDELMHCTLCILAQGLGYLNHHQIIVRLMPQMKYDREALLGVAAYIAETQIAGLKHIRGKLERGESVPWREQFAGR